jgi:hypothetical protein
MHANVIDQRGRFQAFQAQFVKRIAATQANDFGAKTLSPERRLADHDARFSPPVDPVDAED